MKIKFNGMMMLSELADNMVFKFNSMKNNCGAWCGGENKIFFKYFPYIR